MTTEQVSIGVDVGGTKIATGVLRGDQLLSRHVQPTPETGWEAVLDAIATQVQDLQTAHPDARLVGVGIPGPLNADRTRVKFAPNIYGFTDVPMVDGLRDRLGQRIILENDAKAAALAEAHMGAARGTESSIYVTVSTGIGAGIVLNGRIWRGRHGIAGEIGHITALPGGPVSGAGLDGALEAVASGTAIARDASYALNRDVSTAEAFTLAEQGHPAARRIIAQALRHIGIALADLQKTIDPEVFVVGGGVASVGDYFFQGVQRAADEYAAGFAPVTIRRAQLGTDAGVIGAALAARHG
ncbi:ROK family protein [Deinococcus sp. Arct2-2]|uniref:ROK family protein n=1 Tax=Deinococcus sp. Arct2-2 TaxID=2568653 RepID=UPI0010A52A05|nr:ROK family protein [Deinococcus sp. Arct2-2]THF70141.1 ROK family protein [Deinococcus sp. Arct2-2]